MNYLREFCRAPSSDCDGEVFWGAPAGPVARVRTIFPSSLATASPRQKKSRCRSGVVGVDLPVSSRAAPALPLVRGVVSGARASEKRHAHHAPRLTLARGEKENTRETETKFIYSCRRAKRTPSLGTVSPPARGGLTRGEQNETVFVSEDTGAKEKNFWSYRHSYSFLRHPFPVPKPPVWWGSAYLTAAERGPEGVATLWFSPLPVCFCMGLSTDSGGPQRI